MASANTRFKTENGLYVSGGNAEFTQIVSMAANLTVSGDLLYIGGNLYVQGQRVIVGGEVYASSIESSQPNLRIGDSSNGIVAISIVTPGAGFVASQSLTITGGTSGATTATGTATVSGGGLTAVVMVSRGTGYIAGETLNITSGTSTLAATGTATISTRFDNIYANTYNVYASILPFTNAIPLGSASKRFVTYANSIDVSTTSQLTGNVTMSGGLQQISGNVNFDTGTVFIDATTNRLGVNTASPTQALSVVGSANVSSNLGIGGDTTSYGNTATASVSISPLILTPNQPTGVLSSTGGTLAAGNYYVRVTAVSSTGTTLPSTQSTLVTTTGSTSKIDYSWARVVGATSYQVWVTQTSGTYAAYFTTSSTTYSLTTLTGTTAGTLPTVNTATILNGIIASNAALITSTSETIVDSYPKVQAACANYKAFIKDSVGTTLHTINLGLIQDGTNVLLTQYGEIFNTSLGSFDAIINNANVEIKFTATGSPSIGSPYTVKLLRSQIT